MKKISYLSLGAAVALLATAALASTNKTSTERASVASAPPTVKPKPSVTPTISHSDDFTRDTVTLRKVTTTEGPASGSLGNDLAKVTLAYGVVRKDPQLDMEIALAKEEFRGGKSVVTEYSFKSSFETNYWYIYDPIYLKNKKTFVFKYGRGDFSLDSYKIMTYQEGDKEARTIVQSQGNRNRNIVISPDGSYLAFIRGGDQVGPDHAYSKMPLELWVCDISTGASNLVARGDSLNDFYTWEDRTHLIYGVPDKKSYRRFSYEAGKKTSTRTATVEAPEPKERGKIHANLERALVLGGFPSAKLKLPHAPENSTYDKGSLTYTKSKKSILYFTDVSLRNDSGPVKKNQSLSVQQVFSTQECALTPAAGNSTSKEEETTGECTDNGDVAVTTFKFAPYLKTYEQDAELFAAVKSYSEKRSPITKDFEVDIPQKIFTLYRVKKGGSVIGWQREGIMGFSLWNGENSQPFTMFY